MTYRLPPQEVVDIIDAPHPPEPVVNPDGSSVLLVHREITPPLSVIARPFLKLGGTRVDPSISGTYRIIRISGLSLLNVASGEEFEVTAPSDSSIGRPVWSDEGTHFAFSRTVEDGIEVWVGEASTGKAWPIAGLRISDTLAGYWYFLGGRGPISWVRGRNELLVWQVDPGRGPAPEIPIIPDAPRVEESEGKRSQMATFQDLLTNETDENLFEYYARTQVARVDIDSGSVRPIGEAGLITAATFSPDKNYLLVSQIKRPFSYRVPFGYFSRTTEVWNPSGDVLATIADLPVSDEVPRQGVPTGPRGISWQERKESTLVWVEALDDGDPIKPAEHRDKVMLLDAPFKDSAREALKITHRFAGIGWLEDADRALLTEYDRDRRWRTTYLTDLRQPAHKKVLFDLSVQDSYNDPGRPIMQTHRNGDETLLQDGDDIFLSGRGASEQGDRPFLDRFNLETGDTKRLFQCDDESLETFVAFAADGQLITRRESHTEPPNLWLIDEKASRKRLTSYADPHPHITGIHKELVRYQREDGTELSGTLYLPPGYDRQSGQRIPLLIWAYPLEYSDAGTAGQVRGSDRTFTRLVGASALWFVLRGYAVLMDATMPVVGDPETMNDTYIEQVVSSAKAAIDKIDEMGIADRSRVAVSGHSYGAFMTANLLAHSDLFAAGMARSGAYNRSLTPFGFQTERRSYWEATEVYQKVSPFNYASQIKAPLLLIHGAEDNNSGTFTIQSERLFQAIQGTGGTAKLVILPYEGHGYQARESILHVIAESFDWADRYVTRD